MAEERQLQKRATEDATAPERTKDEAVYDPDVDIFETDEEIIVVADMPGVAQDGVEVTLDKDILTVQGRGEVTAPENCRLALAEFSVGDYVRSFAVSNEIDRSKIRAVVKNGVLRVTLPKAEPVKARKIAVEAG